jgi:predicted metal-binding membrane protein
MMRRSREVYVGWREGALCEKCCWGVMVDEVYR